MSRLVLHVETLGALIWFVSAFVPSPVNYVLWGVAIVVEFAGPLSPFMAKWQAQFPPDTEHMAERYGIFTIIVLSRPTVKTLFGVNAKPA